MAELLALRCGLMVAKEYNVRSFDIEMDTSVAINILTHDHPLYSNIVSECKTLLGELGASIPMQIFRKQNAVSNYLAKEGTRMEF